MVIADPFGSWVQGAHEGQQDAIAMRQAQDQAAQSAYGLNRSAAFDPQQYRMLHNAADTSDLELGQNKQIYGENIPYHAAQAGLNRAELGNAAEQVNLGDPGAYYPYATTHGAQFTPGGGISHPVMGQDGQMHYVVTPAGNITSPQQIQAQIRAAYDAARIGIGQEGVELRQEGLGLRYPGGNPMQSGGYLQLPGTPPAAKTTAPATTPNTAFPNTPMNLHPPQAQVDNPYGLDPYAVAKKSGLRTNTGVAA
jgi:hypothetical protein